MAEDQNGGAQTPPETDATRIQRVERFVDGVSLVGAGTESRGWSNHCRRCS